MRHLSSRWLMLLPMFTALAFAGCSSPQSRTGDGDDARRTGLLIEPDEAERVGYAVNWISTLDLPRRQQVTAVQVLDDLIVSLERPTNMISAVSISDGRVLWRQVADGGSDPLYEPTRQGDRLYINSSSQLFTLDAYTGEVIAAADLPAAVDTGHTLVDGRALFGAVNGRVFAVDLESGQVRWSKQLSARISVPPADADTTTLAVDDSGRYAMYDTTDGTLLWYGRTFGRNGAAPAIGEDTVYIPSYDQTLYALSRATGRDRWTYRTTVPLTTGPMLVRDTLMLLIPEQDKVVALDAEDGSVRWEFDDLAIPATTPRDDRILMATPQRLRLVRFADGQTLDDAQTRPLLTALPGPDHSLVLVGQDGRLIRLNPRR
ncbi:MAG: PQQ-binding-like beta-propeller repeat protein [Phycisphaeraceae bacterium]